MTRLGVILQIREGSGVRDLDKVVPALLEHGADPAAFSLCSDEIELHALATEGHMDQKLRQVVAHGLSPVDALRMVTLNAARSLGVQNEYGAIAPGRIASISALRDLRGFEVALMVSRGQLSAKDGEYLLAPDVRDYPSEWQQTVTVTQEYSAETFLFDTTLRSPTVRVIGVESGTVTTKEIVQKVDFEGGRLKNPSGDIAKIAVIDRYAGGDRIGLGLIRGLQVKRGAFAATSNPSLMNVMVVGLDEGDMALAANRVVALQGGTVVAAGGRIVAELATPVFGNLSHEPSNEAIKASKAIATGIRDELGSPLSDVVMSAGLACLAVSIPELKICDRGLVRISREKGQEGVDLVVDREA